MAITLKTSILQDAVAKSIKAVSNNKMLPLTSLICVEVNDSKLNLITFDGSNYLYVHVKLEACEDFYVVVQADKFSKLVSLLTSESVELDVTERALEINANGNYKIEIPLDEEGEMIQFPDVLNGEDSKIDLSEPSAQIKSADINSMITGCKSALATTLATPCYTGYYCGEKIIATDVNKIAALNTKLFNTDVLLAPELVDLLEVITSENIDVYINDHIIFATPGVTVVGRLMDGIEEFAVGPITDLIESDINSKCKVSKTKLMSLIDRIALFVGPYDDKAIRLTFAENRINVESLQANGIESIDYISVENHAPFTCLVDIDYMIDELKALQTDSVEIFYGSDNSLKFVEGNMTIVIALMQEAGE